MDEPDILLTENGIEIVGDLHLKDDRDGIDTGWFDSESGNLWVGGSGADGDLVLQDASGEERIHVDSGHGSNTDPVHVRVFVDGRHGNITLGGDDQGGTLVLRHATGDETIRIDGDAQNIKITRPTGETLVELGRNGNLLIGGGGLDGDLVLNDGEGNQRMHLGAGERNIVIQQSDGTKIAELGRNGNLDLGGGGLDGDVVLRDSEGKQTMHLGGAEQNLVISTPAGEKTVELGRYGNLSLGGHGNDADIVLYPSDATNIDDATQSTLWLNGEGGDMMLGGNGRDGDIALFPRSATISQSDFSKATIHLDGDAGEINFRNGDCAEDFDVTDDTVDAGTVMVLDDSERLRPSDQAYDTRVAGVVSGAGERRPGIVLDKQVDRVGRLPIALVGKVNCLVDATTESVSVGDLLTTAETPGHAMKATARDRSFGAILGKALRPLDADRAIVPVLVALQ